MTNAIDGRLRLTILGGFLGSGKTTWLRHHLHAGSFGRVHVIVNEAADAPVDDALLGAADGMTLLAGACVCCDARETLTRSLLALCDARSATATARLENIVLETSGLADPAAIVTLIQNHPVLVRQILVVETLVIVDAMNALDQLQNEGLSRRQIEAADRIILTKIDIAPADRRAVLRATLRMLAPAAAVSAASFGSAADLPTDAEDTQPLTLPTLADQETAAITAIPLDLGASPDWTAFTVWLSALLYARGDRIVRVKGVIRTPAGRLLLQTVRHTVQSPEVLPEPDTPCQTDNTVAVIGRGFSPEQLTASLAHFSA